PANLAGKGRGPWLFNTSWSLARSEFENIAESNPRYTAIMYIDCLVHDSVETNGCEPSDRGFDCAYAVKTVDEFAAFRVGRIKASYIRLSLYRSPQESVDGVA